MEGAGLVADDGFRDDWDEQDWIEDRAHDRMEEVRERWIARGWWDLKGGDSGMFPNMLMVAVRYKYSDGAMASTLEIVEVADMWVSSEWLTTSIAFAEELTATDGRKFTMFTPVEIASHTVSFLGTVGQIRAKLEAVLQVQKEKAEENA